jgi:hypothetical protein
LALTGTELCVQRMFENPRSTQMDDAVALWGMVCSSQCLKYTSLVSGSDNRDA